ncbi:MAG TPA: tRNA uridine-5-carboxymethylaminomethyl(34) synthesis enzyme MnmG [Gemmatimonadales bacterium]|nr:tRNA uridine-5-carboxymethylaminomethyl(34) synthesis enzyme MnmG [Gemmatimonadales bacterium]
MDPYDVIVIGGGHAGAEAATLAARRGARTLLLTQNLETIGQMSCNPAIGGIAKGTVVREVDALGGVMGRATDLARIQFRMLNKAKGPAVWSPRAQCDRGLYRRAVRSLLELQPNLQFAQGTVASLVVSGKCLTGVVTLDDRTYHAPAVVLTAGTFLRGRIHLGPNTQVPAGRAGESPATEIAHQIEELGLTVKRFKTGTPPRIDGRSVDLSSMVRQDGDPEGFWFSFYQRAEHPEQRPCYLTHTGAELQEIVLRHLLQSALYGGAISGRGPRYCPSIEDKVLKFPDAKHHQVFLEPEGLDTSEMYVNGLSTSLPPSVQLEFLRSVPGLEQVLMTRPGYAIEYDYFPPTQLLPTLESRHLQGLFLAGQVNGTTGYEEAAAQGAVAGINAAARALDLDSIVFGRGEAFLGVLTDDLVTKGVDEPYRLFTSRSEYRLLLRQDNALRRLTPIAQRLGTLSGEELALAEIRLRNEEAVQGVAESTSISPTVANPILSGCGSPLIAESMRIADLARRPGVALTQLLAGVGIECPDESAGWADIEFKYSGYLARERSAAVKLTQMEAFAIPADLEYRNLTTLAFEAREKLHALRPETLGRASRIPGISPSDLHGLILEVARRRSRSGLAPVSRETPGEARDAMVAGSVFPASGQTTS